MKHVLICLIFSFALSFGLCALLIPVLRRAGAGQNILHYVKEHKGKGGTPTMGGLAFILAAAIVSLAACGVKDKPFLVAIAVGVGYLLVGFLDDLIKKKRADNQGLYPYQKILFQGAVAVVASLYCCLNGLTVLRIPFTRLSFNVGWWMMPIGIFVFVATVNSVNLTDGLDGLAGASSAAFFLFTGALIYLQNADKRLALLSFSLTGALAAYLLFNTNRASLFMGDTGSLSLGGFVSSVALFSGNALVIPVVGVMFVLSSISVILQVIYYKKTGRRVFLMAPIHHHFQQKGYSEAKISYAYAAITSLLGAAVLLPFA